MTYRKRSTWMWAAATIVAGPLLYVLSFGPACWWFRTKDSASPPRMYWPIGWIAARTYGGPVHRAIKWYATRRSSMIVLPANSEGTASVLLMTDKMAKLTGMENVVGTGLDDMLPVKP